MAGGVLVRGADADMMASIGPRERGPRGVGGGPQRSPLSHPKPDECSRPKAREQIAAAGRLAFVLRTTPLSAAGLVSPCATSSRAPLRNGGRSVLASSTQDGSD